MTIALVDCNNFFVSCERLFRPDTEGKPVVVLSNNDGCVISRSGEAKALGIPMGAPFFRFRGMMQKEGVEVFSCNHALYGDISRRVDAVLERFSAKTENYSIDESFLDLSGVRTPVLYGHDIRKTVRQWTGIPTCVGIGPTKTLAKLANACAKKMPEFSGVCDLSPVDVRRRMMAGTSVRDIWGVGEASAEKLAAAGIATALDFAQAPAARIRGLLHVQGARLHDEINGRPARRCAPKGRKQNT